MGKLLVRVPNWIGDCIMALPALQRLAGADQELCLLGRAWAAPLLAGCGWPVIELPRSQRAGSATLRSLRAEGFSALTLMTHSCSSAAMAWRAGLPALGYAKDWRGPLLSRRLPWPADCHEVERYWRLATATVAWLGITEAQPAASPPWCHLPLTAEHAAAAEQAFAAAALPSAPVLLCPVATGTVKGQDKQWPHFVELAQALQRAQIALAVVAPPNQEAALRERFGALPILANLSMDAFVGTLAAARLVVANDSGPMHVACALGTPCVVPFGRGITRPEGTGAWSQHLHPVLTAANSASPWPGCAEVEATLRHLLDHHHD